MSIRNSTNPFQSFVPLAGSARTLLPGSRGAGPVNNDEIARVTVRTRTKAGPGELKALVDKLYAVPLAQRQYVSHGDLESQFGALPEDLDAIEDFAQRYRLTVVRRSRAERHIVLQGRLGDLVRAFQADIGVYHHFSGTYRGRKGAVYVPTELAEIIVGVFGLDTRPKRRLVRRSNAVFRAAVAGGLNGLSGIDYAKRYQFPTVSGDVTLDGTGQTIGLIELGGGFQSSDLATFFQDLGLATPSVTAALAVDNITNAPTGNPSGDDGEVLLDIEVVGSAAPGARIVVYFGPNQGSGFLDTVTAAVHDTEHTPSVLSISWGEPDDFLEGQAVTAFQEEFQEAAALGITVCAASGDHGTADLDFQGWESSTEIQTFHVNHPASDPGVLGCGGTQIDANNKDVVWNDGSTLSNGGWATGGGVSSVFTEVPSWQKNAGVPVSLGTGTAGRGVPDVSASAVDYAVVVDGDSTTVGGTSAATPLWAALIARLNQAKGKNVGFLNPFLYQNAAKGITTDVVTGNNGIAGTIKGYEAGAGWDACTGLGTPVGTTILELL